MRILSRSDMLVICGTNVVSDYMTGPRGWPYDLFKWSILATLFRVRALYLGVGVGPINHPVSRWLIRHSLRLAHFRSYRDEVSRINAESIGVAVRSDIVCPDLVFGLSPPAFPARLSTTKRTVIGVGLKDYGASSDGIDMTGRRNYIKTMATFISFLCEHAYDVRVLIGDFQYDAPIVEEILSAVHKLPVEGSRIFCELALNIPDLIDQIAGSDLVVSPRFHNLVLGAMLGKPVIALSDHHKLSSLMEGLGLGDYCLSLDGLEADEMVQLLLQVQQEYSCLQSRIDAKVTTYRAALDQMYFAAFNLK